MDHSPLNGAGSNDGDLDYEVVKASWLQPRQHRHLGSGFDLKYADGLGCADHVVGIAVFSRNILHLKGVANLLANALKGSPYGREHAKGQDIDL